MGRRKLWLMPRKALTRATTGPVDAFRVLILVEDAALGGLIAFALRHGSFEHRTTATLGEARSVVTESQPHLVLVDIDVEHGRAVAIIDDVSAMEHVAVIALTRRSDLRGKLDAFHRGADDYIGVPFVPDDLVARVHAVMRRVHGSTGKIIPHLRIGDLEIDVLNRRVRAGESELHLTSLEQALLYLLAANAGTVLSREKILDSLWGTDFVIESNVVDRHVRALRAKLQNDWRRPRYIETVPGAGYRFVAEGET